jgi:hypothetical protein
VQRLLRGGGVEPGSQSQELISCRLEFEIGRLLVMHVPEAKGEQGPTPGHLVGSRHLPPVPDGSAELFGGSCRVAFG